MEVNPAAWLPVGRMSAEVYRQVLQSLEQIAETASALKISDDAAAAAGDEPLRLVVNEVIEVRYEIDPFRRVVRLVDLHLL